MLIIKRLFICALLLVFFSGCTVTKEKEVKVESKSLQPKRKPVYNSTNMDNALKCIDNKLSNPKIEKIRIFVDNEFPDLGSAGVRSTRDMIITALMKLSTKSRKVGPILIQQGSDLNRISNLSPTGSRFKFPQYFLRGSITQAEKGHSVGGKTQSASLGIPKILNIGAQDSVKNKVSSVGLDLHLGDIDTVELIPGMYSSNMLSIIQQDEAGNAYAGIMEKADFEYEVEFSEREGMSSAVRTLTELGVLEIIGKLFALDYQSCVNPKGVKKVYQQPVIVKQEIKKPVLQATKKIAKQVSKSVASNFSIEMSSDRGQNPVYAKGEKIRILAFPQNDMHLYCFYQDNNKNTITQLFPNSYSPVAHRVKGEVLELPSAEMPFSIEMDKSSTDVIACFGTKNDIGSKLNWKSLEEISGQNLQSVKETIKRIASDVVSSQLTITIQ
jgi:hypothetical protein